MSRRGRFAMPRVPLLAVPLLSLSLLGAGCKEPEPQFKQPMMLGGQKVSAETLNRGHRVYALYCSSCHGRDGSGEGNASHSLAVKPRDFRQAEFKYKSTGEDALPTDDDLSATILRGRVENGMPAWNGLTPEDRDAVIQYLKTFSPRWATQEVPRAEPPP